MRMYEVLAGKPLDEHLDATVIIAWCVKHVTGRLELETKEMQHPRVRQAAKSFT